MAPRASKREDIMTADISRDLERLFDPYNFDHIPKEDDRLALFKQRDLPHIKHYKAAVKIFGGPHRRTRTIVAPPMETPLKHRLGLYLNKQESQPPKQLLNGPLRPPPEPVKELTEEEKSRNAETEKTVNYKSWVSERQKLRNNLNGLALNEAMLARKPNKTELETRVQAKFKADREWKPESPPPREETPPPKPAPDIPTMNVPPPDGLQILDKFLSLNRMRLLDLFKITDKDKSWTLSREEFLNAVSQSAMPISEGEVDDMFIALDSDLDEELTFSELNKGLSLWRRQRRGVKKNSFDDSSTKTSTQGSSSPSRAAPASGSTVKHGSVQDRAMSKRSSRENVEKPPSRDRTSSKKSSNESQERATSQERTALKKETTDQLTSQGLAREDSNMSKSSLKSSQIKASTTSAEKGSDTKTVRTVGTVYDTMPKSRERSNVSSTKIPASEGSTYKTATETTGDISYDLPRPASQTRVKIMDVPAFSESSLPDTIHTDGQTDKSLYEDLLFQSGDTPRVPDVSKDADDNTDDDGAGSKTYTEKSTRIGSRRTGSATSDTRSRTSTPNSLEPPDFDTRTESRAPESAEAMLDIRKHDRVVLSRNTIRRNLSRDKRVTFDEHPGVIKVGYKAIDDHCADSTLKGEHAGMVEQFRRETLKEYFEVRKLFEERGITLTQKTLDRVLLYPGDRTTNVLKKGIALPLGPLTNEHSPFNQPKPKKKPPKRRRAFATRMAKTMPQSGGQGNGKVGGGVGGGGVGGGGGGGVSEDDGSGSASSKRSFITVEDVYPFAATVTPKVYKENLSSGRAFISRKIDNWMTFEEYTKYTQHLRNRFQQFNRPSNPDTVWPGYVLDKVRLCMPPYNQGVDGKGHPIRNRDFVDYEGLGTGLYNGKGHAVFQSTAQNKMAYPGYNNDLITWPVGPNGVMYGNIDEHRIVR